MTVKILFFAGASRKDSANKKLARAAYQYAKEKGVEATFVDLVEYTMPLYDGDWEDANGLPENAKKLKKILSQQDGFFIASPEYNSAYSALLKNVIDWCTRTETKDEPALIAFRGKVAGLSAASPGALGGLRGLVPLRMLLGNIAVHVIPNQFALGGAYGAFDDAGALKDEAHKKQLANVVDQLIDTARKLKA